MLLALKMTLLQTASEYCWQLAALSECSWTGIALAAIARCMPLNVVDQEKLHSICAQLQEHGVCGSVIDDFKSSWKKSEMHAGAAGEAGASWSADDVPRATLATPARNRADASLTLSPIDLDRHSASPSSRASPLSNSRRGSHNLKERAERFDFAPSAIDYSWVSKQMSDRKTLVEKLLRSPRPPTSEEKAREPLAAADSNFDAYSEHAPDVHGLHRLYIPPPSPKVPRQCAATSPSNLSSDDAYSRPSRVTCLSSPGAPSPARSLQKLFSQSMDGERFDSFPDQDYATRGSSAAYAGLWKIPIQRTK
jgi:hypothetical protein